MPRFLALQAEWRRHPPAHWLVAATLKYKPPDETTRSRQPSMAELKSAFPDGKL